MMARERAPSLEMLQSGSSAISRDRLWAKHGTLSPRASGNEHPRSPRLVAQQLLQVGAVLHAPRQQERGSWRRRHLLPSRRREI